MVRSAFLFVAAVAVARASDIEFGIHDFEVVPAGGWTLMSGADFNTHKLAFITSYNAKQGVAPIKTFQSGN